MEKKVIIITQILMSRKYNSNDNSMRYLICWGAGLNKQFLTFQHLVCVCEFHRYALRTKKNNTYFYIYFGGGRGLNPGPCIYYALSLRTELSSRGHTYFYIPHQC